MRREYTPKNRKCFLAWSDGDEAAHLGITKDDAIKEWHENEDETFAEGYMELNTTEHSSDEEREALFKLGLRYAAHEKLNVESGAWVNLLDLFTGHTAEHIGEILLERAYEELDDDYGTRSELAEQQRKVYFGENEEEERELALRLRKVIRDYAQERGHDVTDCPFATTDIQSEDIDDLSPWSVGGGK